MSISKQEHNRLIILIDGVYTKAQIARILAIEYLTHLPDFYGYGFVKNDAIIELIYQCENNGELHKLEDGSFCNYGKRVIS